MRTLTPRSNVPQLVALVFLALLSSACASNQARDAAEADGGETVSAPGGPAAEQAAEPSDTEAGPPEEERTACNRPGSERNAWLDKFQRSVYRTVCGSAVWFDGFFGDPLYDKESNDTFGRLSLGTFWDDRDGVDPETRLRARFSFPSMKKRVRFLLARGDTEEVIEERSAQNTDALPRSFRNVTDDSWLFGLGYGRQKGVEKGWDFSAGVRIRTPIEPYAKAEYRWNYEIKPNVLFRFRETPFWRETRGFGASTGLTLDTLLSPRYLLRWTNVGTVAEDTDGLDWGTSLTLYQSLRQRRAMSYSALIRGETNADVRLQNYGAEIRYRQNFLRPWFFVEFSGSGTWPRELRTEERKFNPGVGVSFEMYFGPVPEDRLR